MKRIDLMSLLTGQVALQSSFSQWSHPDDPLRAISGSRSGAFSFHTEMERDPWWMVDLGCICKIERIIVYNREDTAQDRARFFSIDIFEPALGGWRSVYVAENEFGGFADNNPLKLNFGSAGKMGRYVKLSIQGENCLHLDQVQIFGVDAQKPYEQALKSTANPAPLAFRRREIEIENDDRGLGAIVGLVRGYKEIANYDALIARNAAIYEKINKNRDVEYPLLVWHEGNITSEHQEYILSKEKNRSVRFIDISERFKLPASLTPDDMEESWPLGYRLMCKFNCFDIFELTENFDYILRIDEDCILSEIVADPFLWMHQADLDCAFSWMIKDSLALTNESFPCFVEAFYAANGITPTVYVPPASCFPYSNVMMVRGAFFRSEPVWNYLTKAVAQPEFYIKRWGDHIVLGVPLQIYSRHERIRPIEGLRYTHHSHNTVVVANDDHRCDAMKPSYFDPNSLSDLSCAELERELLRLFKQWPINYEVRSRLVRVLRATGRHAIADRLLSPIKTVQPSQMLQVIPHEVPGEEAGQPLHVQPVEPELSRRSRTAAGNVGIIDIALPCGASISVDASVNEKALARVLRAIKTSS